VKEKIPILEGDHFGLLTTIRLSSRDIWGRARWLCSCVCGSSPKEYAGYSLKSGNTKSCGCLQRKRTSESNTTHGHTKIRQPHSPEYRSWQMMVNRCTNPRVDNYSYYGGRGIKVCDRWFNFENFLKDLGIRLPKTTLGRLLDRGNYQPGNVFWMTSSQQREQAILKTIAWG
jgi:hypothetical protein